MLLLGALALAGCLAAPQSGAPGSADEAPTALADLPALPATFDVMTRAGGPVRLSALVWFPEEETRTVTLAIHGSGGCRDCWGGVGIPGYSFASREVARGRALVAIHLPGFGDSQAVAMSYSHGGFSEDFVACQGNGARCPEDPRSINWLLPHADPEVIAASANLSVPRDCAEECAAVPTNFWAWSGCTGCLGGEALRPLDLGPAPDEVTRAVTVPVLVVVGAEDFYYDQAAVGREGEHFPNAADFTLLRPEDTGHMVLLHRSGGAVQDAVGQWLDERGFGS